jgi:hypothetical protein
MENIDHNIRCPTGITIQLDQESSKKLLKVYPNITLQEKMAPKVLKLQRTHLLEMHNHS